MSEPLLRVRGLTTHFSSRGGWFGRRPGPVRAVDGVDLDIARGEVVGLVGESGSGKTTLGKAILGLAPRTAGEVVFDGRDISHARAAELRGLRRHMQMVFQDPHGSLSPRLSIGYLLTEPYQIHAVPEGEQRSAAELLEMVELSPELASKHPHELSGGQARRVGLARALALNPDLLVADEPTSGLDVSAASAVLNLMRDLGERLGLTYLVITHNLNVVDYIADRLAVMYLGSLVELGPTEELLDAPAHPYTQALLAAISVPDPRRRSEHRLLVPGEIPSPVDPPSGCRFHPRCPYADERSRTEAPELETVTDEHLVACHHWRRIRDGAVPAGARSGELG